MIYHGGEEEVLALGYSLQFPIDVTMKDEAVPKKRRFNSAADLVNIHDANAAVERMFEVLHIIGVASCSMKLYAARSRGRISKS